MNSNRLSAMFHVCRPPAMARRTLSRSLALTHTTAVQSSACSSFRLCSAHTQNKCPTFKQQIKNKGKPRALRRHVWLNRFGCLTLLLRANARRCMVWPPSACQCVHFGVGIKRMGAVPRRSPASHQLRTQTRSRTSRALGSLPAPSPPGSAICGQRLLWRMVSVLLPACQSLPVPHVCDVQGTSKTNKSRSTWSFIALHVRSASYA